MRWYWVRHAPTHEKAFTGWRDIPADLSDTPTLLRLAQFLPAATIVSSDLCRAYDTASALMAARPALGPRLPNDPDLREFDFGDWDGKHWRDVAALDPERSRAYWETPGDVAPPHGESWNAAAHRGDRAVERTRKEIVGQDVIVVAHMGVILTRIERALGCPPKDALSHEIPPLSVTVIEQGNSGPASYGRGVVTTVGYRP